MIFYLHASYRSNYLFLNLNIFTLYLDFKKYIYKHLNNIPMFNKLHKKINETNFCYKNQIMKN